MNYLDSAEKAMYQLSDFNKNEVIPAQTSFIKNLITISGIILSLLASFSPPSPEDRLLFRALLVSFLSCILFGSITLYILLFQHRTLSEDTRREIERALVERDPQMRTIFSRYGKSISFFENICSISFLISLVLLVCYAW